MSDDEDYYDFEEEYIYEDAVPDLVVSESQPLVDTLRITPMHTRPMKRISD
jgi:hypothetical protein